MVHRLTQLQRLGTAARAAAPTTEEPHDHRGLNGVRRCAPGSSSRWTWVAVSSAPPSVGVTRQFDVWCRSRPTETASAASKSYLDGEVDVVGLLAVVVGVELAGVELVGVELVGVELAGVAAGVLLG